MTKSLKQRLRKLEKPDEGRWFSPDEDGNLPDDFNPDIDNILTVTITSEDSPEPSKTLYWRGEPLPESENTINVTIPSTENSNQKIKADE